MPLFNSCMRLKDDGLIKNFDMHGDEFATIHRPNGNSYLVYMVYGDIMGASAIAEACSTKRPDFIVYNAWQLGIEAVRQEAKRRRIRFLSFTQFRRVLKEL